MLCHSALQVTILAALIFKTKETKWGTGLSFLTEATILLHIYVHSLLAHSLLLKSLLPLWCPLAWLAYCEQLGLREQEKDTLPLFALNLGWSSQKSPLYKLVENCAQQQQCNSCFYPLESNEFPKGIIILSERLSWFYILLTPLHTFYSFQYSLYWRPWCFLWITENPYGTISLLVDLPEWCTALFYNWILHEYATH